MSAPRLRQLFGLAMPAVLAVAGLGVGLGIVACSPAALTAGTGKGPITVVAAEGTWGSLAQQIGGSRVAVTSLITRPDVDPHSYEATAEDGRRIATARMVLVNGLGYDTWARQMVSANPDPRRVVLDVGALVGRRAGDNPHRWYYPGDVRRVIDRLAADFSRLDPGHAAYFRQRQQRLEAQGFRAYDELLTGIRTRYAGVPVGASESIFVGLAQAVGLDLRTPGSFLQAMSEGNDPSAADKSTVDRQLTHRTIRVFVYNPQNATPDVARLVAAARSHQIPVVRVTETLTPAGATFQAWQVAQLRALAAALRQATGR